MINKLKLIFLIINLSFLPFFLTGCWSNVDLTELAIAAAIGIDRTEKDEIELTVQIVKPDVIKAHAQGSEENPVWVYSATGETVFSAIRNLLSTSNRRTFFSHVQLMVIGEKVAREGILDVLDLFERDKETQRMAYMLISREISAREVLGATSELENIAAIHIKSILDNSTALARIKKITLIDMLKCMNCKGYSPSVGVISKSKKEAQEKETGSSDNGVSDKKMSGDQEKEELEIKDLRVEGAAVFKKDKLAGWLNSRETRGLLFAQNEVQSGIIDVDNPYEQGKKIGFEITKSAGKLDFKMNEGKKELIIEIKAEGRMADQQGRGDLTKPDMLKKMEKSVASIIENDIRLTVHKAQKDLKTDFIGFAPMINKNYLSYWKTVEEDWSQVFSQLPVVIKVNWTTNNASLIKRPSQAR